MSACHCTGACKLTGKCPNTIKAWKELRDKQEPLDPDISKLIDNNFWHLIGTDDSDEYEEHF